MTNPKSPDDDMVGLAHVPAADQRLVSTESGLAVLASGGSVEDALAADAEQDARHAARLAAEAQEREDRAARRQLDLAERRIRLADRLRRQRAREARENGSGDRG